MAELADALDLGSSSSECRFDSCYPHSKSRRAAILVGFRLLFLGSGNKMVIYKVSIKWSNSFLIGG